MNRRGYETDKINAAILKLINEANNSGRSLYDNNEAVYKLLRFGVDVKTKPGERTKPVIGKPPEVLAFSWIAVRSGVARLPESVTWKMLSAASILTGIGFTMSLFIAGLALEEQFLNPAKPGVLTASVACTALGMFFLSRALPCNSRSNRRDQYTTT